MKREYNVLNIESTGPEDLFSRAILEGYSRGLFSRAILEGYSRTIELLCVIHRKLFMGCVYNSHDKCHLHFQFPGL